MVCPVCITSAVVANLPVISASIGGLTAVKACQQSQRVRELREQRAKFAKRAKSEKEKTISAKEIHDDL
jgi:hypothetical protein